MKKVFFTILLFISHLTFSQVISKTCNTTKIDSRGFNKTKHTERQRSVLIYVYWKVKRIRLRDLGDKILLFGKTVYNTNNKKVLIDQLNTIIDIEEREIATLENTKSQIDEATQDLDRKYYCYLTFNAQVYKNTREIIQRYDVNIFSSKLEKFIQLNAEEDKLKFNRLLKALNDLDYQFHLSQMN